MDLNRKSLSSHGAVLGEAPANVLLVIQRPSLSAPPGALAGTTVLPIRVVLALGIMILLGGDGHDTHLRDTNITSDSKTIILEQRFAPPLELVLGNKLGEPDARLGVVVLILVVEDGGRDDAGVGRELVGGGAGGVEEAELVVGPHALFLEAGGGEAEVEGDGVGVGVGGGVRSVGVVVDAPVTAADGEGRRGYALAWRSRRMPSALGTAR